MTAAEWPRCGDTGRMLELLAYGASERKLRLFACACCRRVWGSLVDDAGRGMVAAAERYADGELDEAGRRELLQAYNAAHGLTGGFTPAPDPSSTTLGDDRFLEGVARRALELAVREYDRNAPWALSGDGGDPSAVADSLRFEVEEAAAQAALVRDIFGNPFRHAMFEPGWRAPEVLAVARATYDHRELPAGTLDTARPGVLADALEEAGAEGGVLKHLRGPGPHVRGCWAVDLVLGKG